MTAPRTLAAGRYEVLRELGKGGQKIVYLVRDTTLQRECALSLIDAEVLRPEDVARLKNEAQTLARMGAQPHVVTVYDMGEDAGRPYLVCEWVAGGDLSALLKNQNPLSIERALQLTADVLRGLAAAHDRGIIHRDLKPSNVWIDENGSAKLGDFGIALSHDRSRLTATGAMTGTPAYCAPEQLDNRPVDGRTDLYALGCVLYELVTGHPPFQGTVVAIISQQLHALPTPPSLLCPELSPELEAFILSLVAKDPALRPPTAREALLRLAAIAEPHSHQPEARSSGATPAAVTPLLFSTPTPALPTMNEVTSGRRGVFAAAALALIALPIAWHFTQSASAPDLPSHRVAIIAMKSDALALDPSTTNLLALRLIEEVDRYSEFRPVSAIGLTLERQALLGGRTDLPDEAEVKALATHLGADTVVAISGSTSSGEGFEIQAHVFDTKDPAQGVSGRRVRLNRSDLDQAGPARLAESVTEALGRHWRRASFTTAPGVAAPRLVPFEDFQRASIGESYCVTGRFDACEKVFRDLLANDPDNAFYLMKLSCALAYQGKDAEAEQAFVEAQTRREKLTNRRSILIYEFDRGWLEADRLRRTGAKEESRARANQMLELTTELEREYQDPWGTMYAAATWQYLLDDLPRSRRIYAGLRDQHPNLFPAYYEEAKLLANTDADGRRQASLLMWTFIQCFPSSEMVTAARAAFFAMHLEEPSSKPICPTSG